MYLKITSNEFFTMLQYYMKITHVLYILLYHSHLIGCIHLLMHYNSEDEGEAEDFIVLQIKLHTRPLLYIKLPDKGLVLA